jgi:glycosyltransferase involved in cell wall biosynthesis
LQANFVKKIGVLASKYLITRYATAGLAVSNTAVKRFGAGWEKDPRWQIQYLGIDLSQFKTEFDCQELRRELGIPKNFLVIGHVGRFNQQKNHSFLLDIFAKTLELEPETILLLVGDGTLRQEIEAKAKHLGLAEKVMFLGTRRDVPLLMKGAMDVFVMPSLFEGLPLVLMETQAAGLPSIVSSTITEEADVIKPLIERLSIQDAPDVWATRILQLRNNKKETNGKQALRIMEQSPFNIETACKKLFELYEILLSQKKIMVR